MDILGSGNRKEKVGHFIALLKQDGYIEHFDPYGLNIEQELSITHEQGVLKSLLEQAGKVVTNQTQLQQWKDDIQTCGRWCVARVRMRDLNLREFIQFFKQSILTGDQKVTLMTYFKA